jgi:alkaline phosphatase D
MKTVGFGSCNRQNLDQCFWKELQSRHDLDMWLWAGDAYYAKNNSISGMTSAAHNLTTNTYYREFLAGKVTIAGVWDDHDYGINDAGKYATQKSDRKEQYLNFNNFSSRKDFL